MDKQLQKVITEKTPPALVEKAKESFASMIIKDSEFPLEEATLTKALALPGKYVLLELELEEIEEEIASKHLQYLISEALSIVIYFEDDTKRYEDIRRFLSYVDSIATKEQTLLFGIKKVEKLSKTPLKILFSGILPINQLRIYLGKDIYELLEKHQEEFEPKFQALREAISAEIGLRILPLFPIVDEKLSPNKVKLVDNVTKEVIASFETSPFTTQEGIDIYLIKLFYIYKQLAKDICNKG